MGKSSQCACESPIDSWFVAQGAWGRGPDLASSLRGHRCSRRARWPHSAGAVMRPGALPGVLVPARKSFSEDILVLVQRNAILHTCLFCSKTVTRTQSGPWSRPTLALGYGVWCLSAAFGGPRAGWPLACVCVGGIQALATAGLESAGSPRPSPHAQLGLRLMYSSLKSTALVTRPASSLGQPLHAAALGPWGAGVGVRPGRDRQAVLRH